MTWNDICLNSIRQERKEAEERYNVRIGQTEIYCQRCGLHSWPDHHTCRDIQLKNLQEVRRLKIEEAKGSVDQN